MVFKIISITYCQDTFSNKSRNFTSNGLLNSLSTTFLKSILPGLQLKEIYVGLF